MKMVSLCYWSKDWAIIRRYFITLLRYPFSSISRVILAPGFILSICWYVLNGMSGEYADNTKLGFVNYLAAITLFTTMLNVYSFANALVNDKATGMKSLMISMNLPKFNYYRATTLCFLALILPVTVIIAVLSKEYVFDSSVSYAAVLGLFILFSLHVEALVTAFVSFITSTNYTFIILVLLVLENLVHELAKNYASWSPALLFLLSFSPYEAIRLFSDEYLAQKQTDGTRISQPYYLIFLAQVFWTLVFKLFAYWFEEVCPWQITSGVRHPFFCFGASKKSMSLDSGDAEIFADAPPLSAKYFESINKEPNDMGIVVRNVTKSYSNVPAVNDVSFSIYKGETTLLLGHNGAGKSTLMNMILGLTEPDKGAVRIMARSQISASIGVCPQTSVLDDDLTVKEHLELFNDIKSSLGGRERAAHIRQTIDDVSLTGQEEKMPSQLSGGMKRKLSLAIAFIGKSEVLILDEPSSGLDPDSRMFIWNAIRRYRSDRTVLLSTQHMEEADYLGDRIAIMSSGRIVCCGSSVFLNRLLGTGYKLRIECKLSRKKHIMDLIRHSYFDAAQLTESGADLPRDLKADPVVDLVVELNKSSPSSKSDNDSELNLIRLLEDFENNSETHGIRSYGLKSSSIEDVMLNTSKYFAPEARDTSQLVMTSTSGHIAAITDRKVIRKPTSMVLLYALIVKHLQVNYANWIQVLILRILLPLWGSYLVIERLSPAGPRGVTTNFQSPTLCIMFSHLIYFPVRERASKFKTVQLDSKARVWLYWLSQAIVDLSGAVVCAIYVSMFAAIYVSDYILVSRAHYYALLVLATLLYYLSAMSFCYLLSTIIENPKSSIGYLFVTLLMTSAVWLVIMLVRMAFFKLQAQWLQEIFAYLGVLFSPTDAYAFFIMGLLAKCYVSERQCEETSGVSPVLIGLMALCIQIATYLALLVLVETQTLNIEWYFNWRNLFAFLLSAPRPLRDNREVDRDVAEETTRALSAINRPDSEHALVAAELNKSYVKHTKIIENLSFTVKKGECFGLLGVNGAGKTTTFSMLAAETCPDAGRILANGHYYDQDLHKYRETFGYDPQATPEISLTPYQALYLMARLRGVNEHSIPMMIGSILELLEMSMHTHKPDKKLSGGTKRKLALGMALIGNPVILALDEPTAGVDPLARRGVWQLLRSLRTRNDASIIISSHAMEECEAICDRISIMARGRLRCIGTFLHLRSKFARGCMLRVQFSSVTTAARSSRAREYERNSSSDSGSQRHAAVAASAANAPGASHHSLAAIGPSRAPLSRHSSTSSLHATEPLVDELQHELNSVIGPSVFKLADRNVNSVTFNITDNRVRRSILFRMMRDFRQKHPTVNYMINDSSLEEIFISLAREQQEFEQQQHQQISHQQPHQL